MDERNAGLRARQPAILCPSRQGAPSPLEEPPSDALYLAWIDFRALGTCSIELQDFLLRPPRLWLDQGTKFGVEGEGFMRINLAFIFIQCSY